MAVGERISSVFNGAADKDAYNQVALVPKERTIKVPSDAKRKRLENLYAQVRKIRENKTGYERLGEIWETQQAEHPNDWLLSMEIFEILDATDQQPELKANREVPEREEDEDERSLDIDRLGIPPGRVPQEARIPDNAACLSQVGVAASNGYSRRFPKRHSNAGLQTLRNVSQYLRLASWTGAA